MTTVVSLSGGKDSTAMLLEMIKRGEQIDEIIFCDTTVEFPVMYEHLDKLEEYIGRKITRLVPEKDFEYYLCEHKKTRGRKTALRGYGFPTPGARWCTAFLKKQLISRYLKEKYRDTKVCQCIGLAADEQHRVDSERLYAGFVRYPLIEYGITEEQALQMAYLCGFDWGGHYKYKKRLSCWCCPLQTLDDLRFLYFHHPELWAKLKYFQNRSYKPFRLDYTIEALERMFQSELLLKLKKEQKL